MNVLTKNFLTVAILGTLGLGAGIKTVYANQGVVAVVPMSEHYNNQNNTQEVSDGDGEAKDDTNPPQQVKKQNQTQESDENEENEGPKDNDSTHEDSM